MPERSPANPHQVTPVEAGATASSSSEDTVPDFKLIAYQGQQVLGGEEVQFSELLGQGKPVVLNFWAGLCPPCRLEMPDFAESTLSQGTNRETSASPDKNKNRSESKGKLAMLASFLIPGALVVGLIFLLISLQAGLESATANLVNVLPIGFAFAAGMVASVNPCGFSSATPWVWA